MTCNIYIRSINSFLTWLFENGHIREPLKIKQLKEEKRVRQEYSDAELSVLLSFKPRTFYEWRLYALISLLVDTGVRIDEALTLTQENVDLDNLVLTVHGKGNKERKVPLLSRTPQGFIPILTLQQPSATVLHEERERNNLTGTSFVTTKGSAIT